MLKRRLKIYCGICGMILISVFAVVIIVLCSNQANAAEKQTDVLMKEIEFRVVESLKTEDKYTVNGLPIGLSSNPYDYVVENEEFDKLVKLGEESLDTLYEIQQDKEKYDSFERYIIAIAIEDIAKVDLKKSEKYYWFDADSFSIRWDKFQTNAKDEIIAILSNEKLSSEEKKAEICFYGTIAINAMEKMDLKKFTQKDIEIIEESKQAIKNLSKDEIVDFAIAADPVTFLS